MTVHHRTCSLCDAQCRLRITLENKRIQRIEGDRDDPFSHGHICPKGVAIQDLHHDPDRLRTPLRRTPEGFVPVSWEEALEGITTHLAAIRREHGRDATGVYIGNPNVHHVGNLLGLALLLNVVDSRARFSAQSVDNLPHVFAAHAMFGHGLLMGVPDVDRTEHMLILGANPWVSNGGGMSSGDIRRRLKGVAERGTITVIDPRRTETADAIATAWHPIRPGTDALLLLSMVQVLFAEERIAPGTWQSWCTGLDTLREISTPFTPETVAPQTGLSAHTIRQLVHEFASAPSATLYIRIGACTQRFGGLTSWLAVVLHALTGNLDRPGGLMFPRPAVDTAAITHLAGESGHVQPNASRGTGLPAFTGELPVAAMAEEIETPGPGQIRAMLTLAGNLALSAPDSGRMERALSSLDLHVVVGLYLDETARLADWVLPASSPLQRDHFPMGLASISVRNVTSFSERLFDEDGGRDDWDIFTELAQRLARRERRRGWTWTLGAARALGPRRILDGLLRAGPYGLGRGGLTLARLQASRQTVDLGALQACLPERIFHADRQVHLAPEAMLADLPRLAAELETSPPSLVLIGRRQLRSNNSWMHNSARLMRGRPRCTAQLHPDDAARLGIVDGQRVRLRTRIGEVETTAEVTDALSRGVVSLPHGWGHDREGTRQAVAAAHPGANANRLTDARDVDLLTGTAAFNGMPVSCEPA